MFPQSAIQSLLQGICIRDDLYLCLAWMILHIVIMVMVVVAILIVVCYF